MKVTLKDIAKILNVNEATVSYVLNNRPKAQTFKAETREQILKIAQALNYHPNAAAQALSTKKTGNIGFILSDQIEDLWENPYFARLLAGIEEECREKNVGLLINAYNLSNLNEFIFPRQVNQSRVDGLILSGYIANEIIEKFQAASVPFVCLGGNLEDPSKDVVTYSFDMNMVMLEVFKHIRRMGHRRIAYPVPNAYALLKRAETLKEMLDTELKDVELIPVLLPDKECNSNSVDFIFDCIFSQPASRRATALVTSIQACLGMCRKLRRENMQCPRDLSLMSTIDCSSCLYSDPPLAGINLNLKKLASNATAALLAHLNDGVPLQRTVCRDVEDIKIVLRESCVDLKH